MLSVNHMGHMLNKYYREKSHMIAYRYICIIKYTNKHKISDCIKIL